jgi:ABC-type lipoprotein export system ATPase subunit/ABC-type antimicrobial peptide transport system permease subunit
MVHALDEPAGGKTNHRHGEREEPMELIRLENIRKTYRLGEVDVPVLRGVSLTIAQGEMVALMGASGSGKTTLMNILGCLDRPTSGKYWLDGQEMSGLTPNQRALVRTEKLGFVFQSFNLLSRTTALHNVLMPLDYSRKRPSHSEARRLAQTLLSHVGLNERIDHEPSQMSGGQQQRVAIGRSLINRPALLLADEPTGNLDSRTSVEILRMFQQLNAEGITVILVTHDPKVAAYAHRTIRVVDGLVENDGASSPVSQGESQQPPLPASGEDSAPSTTYREDRPEAGRSGWSGPALPEGSAGHPGMVVADPAATMAIAATATSSRQTQPARKAIGPRINSLYGEAVVKQRGWAMPKLFPPTCQTALNALRRNAMRSALTALGIIMGVGAVITMTEIGQGTNAEVAKTIANMGANRLLLRPGALMTGGVSLGSGTAINLTPRDVEEIGRQCPAVSQVAPIVGVRAQVIYGNRNWVPQSITGSTPSYLAIRDWDDLEEGSMFTESDVHNAAKVCVIGDTVRDALFEGESPIGQEVRVQNTSLRVIGVLSRKGANMMGQDQDDLVLAPWTTIKFRVCAVTVANINQSATIAGGSGLNTLSRLYPGGSALYDSPSAAQVADSPQQVRFANVSSIYIKAASADDIPEAMDEVEALLRERHHLRPERPDDFNIQDLTEVTKALASTSRLMSLLLLVVAAISLAVGGVGIMNIMLVSVTERTREIGLRMAVGARSHHILRQFLIEAVVLCLFGGAMGIVLGRGASYVVRSVLHWPTMASLPAVIAAVVVSAVVGVVFGFYPAWKASRLDPIEALRYD